MKVFMGPDGLEGAYFAEATIAPIGALIGLGTTLLAASGGGSGGAPAAAPAPVEPAKKKVVPQANQQQTSTTDPRHTAARAVGGRTATLLSEGQKLGG